MRTVYVTLADDSVTIIGVYQTPPGGQSELLYANDPRVVAFLGSPLYPQVYVLYNADSSIKAIYDTPQPFATSVDADDPAVLLFLNPPAEPEPSIDYVYVIYDNDGTTIKSIFAAPQNFTTTPLAKSDDKVTAFLAKPTPVTQITRRQMLLILTAAGFITADEAVAAATAGALPAMVAAYIGTMAPADQVAARITWASMSVCERDDPMLAALAAANWVTSAQLDAFFLEASAL